LLLPDFFASLIFVCPAAVVDLFVALLSGQLLGSADVFGTVCFSAAVAADNSRFVAEAFDTVIVFLGLKGTHMHFVLFDITSHDVLPSLFCLNRI